MKFKKVDLTMLKLETCIQQSKIAAATSQS